MKRQYIKAFNALQKMGIPVYEHVDDRGNFSISSEEPQSDFWVDYYSMAPGWVFGVHPAVDSKLKEFGLWAEWVNPGRLSVYGD
jgi:hypothetical protein